MRRLLAASLIAVSVLAVSAVANAQKGAPSPSAPEQRCFEHSAVVAQMTQDGGRERAYRAGGEAIALLAALNAPAGTQAVAVFEVEGGSTFLLVIFNARGCASGMGEFPRAVVERLLAEAGA